MAFANNPKYTGVIPPVITPRTADGVIDTAGLEAVVQHLLAGGVTGLFVLGSSGEVPYLSNAERELVVSTIAAANDGRVPLIVGANEQTTARVIEEGRRMIELGAQALVVTTPYYALSNAAEIEAHFRAIHAALDVDIFAYDVPVRTHVKLPLDVAIRLAKDGVIVGVKDSSGDDVSFRQLLLATGGIEGFSVFTGHEVVVDGALLGGAHGVVPGLGNVDPAGYRRLFDAAVAGDWAQAAKEQDRLARVFDIVYTPDSSRVSGGAAGLGAFKTALVELGIIGNNTMSTPMESLNAAEAAAIRAILAETGLLAAVAG
ncbi:dihydrodipicolinate synthase family protein [Glutamicibacter nicotianae]|uniref:Dihydrodipicolinate synthase family protein n=1 Tax=Glutamicibacter nicotianae TaxID=37929 RepID=A0ABQ0RHY3_GLUNI|nr:dihydrodipicolinate synthase family protein [Glutamicibacter nicotianae]GEC11066.1 dihydrodipicolinate synthase family protein [Glutamicibacter nicotianae]